MTELLTPNVNENYTIHSGSLDHMTDFGFNLPQELYAERTSILRTFPPHTTELLDAASDHLDRCGRYYASSEKIQNSDRRLEINQGLLLYAAELWYETSNYQACIATLRILRDDIRHSHDTKHLALVSDMLSKISNERSPTITELPA